MWKRPICLCLHPVTRHELIPARGTYALLLSLSAPAAISVGRLGDHPIPRGFYLYIGSALGPGGILARLARHSLLEKKRHWHIDYLRPAALLEQAWVMASNARAECHWAAAANGLPQSTTPMPGFGASDCHCPAHLFHFPARPSAEHFAAMVGIPSEHLEIIEYRGQRA
jgi:Uri superfamily endonuclease